MEKLVVVYFTFLGVLAYLALWGLVGYGFYMVALGEFSWFVILLNIAVLIPLLLAMAFHVYWDLR